MSYNTKNYTEQGGDVTHIGGKLVFDEGSSIAGFPGAENFVPKNTNTGADIRSDLNRMKGNLFLQDNRERLDRLFDPYIEK